MMSSLRMTTCMWSLILALSLGCTHQMAVSNKGFVWQSTLMDIRIGYKLGAAGDVQLEQGKEAISPAAAEMMEEVIPALVEAAVKAALTSTGLSVGGDLLEKCDISDIFDKAQDDEDETVVDPEAMEPKPEKRRRTPEEKAANRARREGSTR